MTIQAGDIKLVASQVMDDLPEGGGAPVATTIRDGVSNSIFSDISELDRAGGAVDLRKVFAHVRTPNTDTYLGCTVIVADPPADPNVSVAIFKASNVFDRRADAANRVEAYLNKGGLWDGFLLENHISGQRAIQIFTRTSTVPPPTGKTLCLIMNEDAGNEYRQYVRVTRATSVVRTFSYESSSGIIDYTAQVITCELSDALLYDFPGSPPSRLYQAATGKTRIRDTLVADASRYYGAAKTTSAISIGAVSAAVNSIYTRIVPSAQTETPIVDALASGNVTGLVDSGNGTVTTTTAAALSPGNSLYLGRGIKPGSLSVSFSGGTLVDSNGDLLSGTTVVGRVDYARGVLTTATSAPTYSGSKTIVFSPATAPLQLADTAAISVSIENRSYNYTMTINPPPAAGTLVVSYMVAGVWYDLADKGTGALRGADSSFGVGSISYATGTASVTLGALPDVGSEVIFAWGSRVSYINRASATVLPGRVKLQLPHGGATPGTVTINWTDTQARSVSDNGKGVMAGSASGTIDYETGVVDLVFSTLPDPAQVFNVAMSYGPPLSETVNNPTRNGNVVNISLQHGGIIPGSVHLTYSIEVATPAGYASAEDAERRLVASKPASKRVIDDGLGNLKDEAGAAFGTINYSTGAIVLNPDFNTQVPVAKYNQEQVGWTQYGASA